MKNPLLIGAAAITAIACACSASNSINEHEHKSTFSKADSVTDIYLVLSDSVLESWNRVVSIEMDKSRTLQELIEDLDHASLLTDELRESFQVRMEQLEKIRFTQESIEDPQTVEDYDVAVASMVHDLNTLTKDHAETMFKYLDKKDLANRISYDSLAKTFNNFVQKNKTMLKEVDSTMKPLFMKMK